jgi:heme A synthase
LNILDWILIATSVGLILFAVIRLDRLHKANPSWEKPLPFVPSMKMLLVTLAALAGLMAVNGEWPLLAYPILHLAVAMMAVSQVWMLRTLERTNYDQPIPWKKLTGQLAIFLSGFAVAYGTFAI